MMGEYSNVLLKSCVIKTCLSVFFETSSEGTYLNHEFRSKPFDAQTEKGNLNNFEANNKSRVRG